MAASDIRNEATYQGYPCQAISFTRSVGLLPETGYVDLSLSDVGRVFVDGRVIPWSPIGGVEYDGGADIDSYVRLKTTVNATVSSVDPPPSVNVKGFNLFGDLVMKSIDENSGAVVGTSVYRNLYIAPGGIHELTQELAEVEKHTQGDIRVPLTDIRMWWRRAGPLFTSLNVRSRSGEWDERTMDRRGGGGAVPWNLKDVLDFLFSQLPGTPKVLASSVPNAQPTNIIGEGQLAIHVIEKLLHRYGLEAGLLPDNNVIVFGKMKNRERGRAGSRQVPLQFLDYEQQTYNINQVPPLVMAVGQRRVQRVTAHCIPVLPDINGLWYTLEAIAARWGYPVDKIRKHAFIHNEYSFRDVPPNPVKDTGSAPLHLQRRKILKKAYRYYMPAFLFVDQPNRGVSLRGPGGGRAAVATGAGGTDLPAMNPDSQHVPFLPMREAAWYKTELENRGVSIPTGTGSIKGDREEAYLMPPVIYAKRVGEDFFTESRIGNKQPIGDDGEIFPSAEHHHKSVIKATRENIERLKRLQETWRKNIADRVSQLNAAESALKGVNSSPEAQSHWFALTGETPVQLGGDFQAAVSEANIRWSDVHAQVKSLMSKQSLTTKREAESYGKLSIETGKHIREERAKLAELESSFKDWRKFHAEMRGVRAIINLPSAPLEDGAVVVDRKTGLIISSEPLCHVKPAIVSDPDEATIVSDGGVTVTFGYELPDNNITAWSVILFSPSASKNDLDPAKLVTVGACRSSPVKATVVKIQGRIYQHEQGTPVNLGAIHSLGVKAAAHLIEVPLATVGYTYTLGGFHDFPMGAGQSGVNYEYDGDKAITIVSVNAPLANNPGGFPGMATNTLHDRASTDDIIEYTQRGE